jgi:hypothetical protein
MRLAPRRLLRRRPGRARDAYGGVSVGSLRPTWPEPRGANLPGERGRCRETGPADLAHHGKRRSPRN